MTEPAVTLTDYGLFIECGTFAWLIARRPATLEALRRWIVAFFVFTAVAALCGGTVHGFFTADDGGTGRVLWKLSMLAIGATALAGWAIGARLLFARNRADRAVSIAAVLAGVYAGTILFVSDAFWVAVVGYLPGAALLFVAFLTAALRGHTSWARLGAWGLALSFLGAAVQQLRIGLHPVYFNHNALYHLVQAVALALVFSACRDLLAPTGGFHANAA
jgi:hypothetical protein